MGSDIKKQNKKIACFILKIDGEIISCNNYAVVLFKYPSMVELIGVHLKDLVPEDFAVHLPEVITQEHLTNGKYYQRVNKCADDTLINTLVKTQYKTINNEFYIECLVKLNMEIDGSLLTLQQYKQTSELLECELVRLNRLLQYGERNEEINSKLKDSLLQICDKLKHQDLLFCSLLLSGFTTKEIATKMFITDLSAYKQRKRIRKKLNIDAETDLYLFLSELIHK